MYIPSGARSGWSSTNHWRPFSETIPRSIWYGTAGELLEHMIRFFPSVAKRAQLKSSVHISEAKLPLRYQI